VRAFTEVDRIHPLCRINSERETGRERAGTEESRKPPVPYAASSPTRKDFAAERAISSGDLLSSLLSQCFVLFVAAAAACVCVCVCARGSLRVAFARLQTEIYSGCSWWWWCGCGGGSCSGYIVRGGRRAIVELPRSVHLDRSNDERDRHTRALTYTYTYTNISRDIHGTAITRERWCPR